MLRYALRRFLLTFPILIGISVVTFFFLSFVPDRTDDPEHAARLDPAELERLRRERFLDLPRFVNPSPTDVEVRAERAVALIAAPTGDPTAAEARAELARLGGAALPFVLPQLDTLAPEPRRRVALALQPIAERMGLPNSAEAADPDRAGAFWVRFWEDRGIEFHPASVRTAVERLARYRTASRAAELLLLDTYALEPVMEALEAPADASAIERARALVEVAAHVTGHDDRIPASAGVAEARAVVERWSAFWEVYRSDYVVYRGASRVSAMLLETRYSKWALSAVTHGLGTGLDGTPVLERIERRAPVTLIIVFGAIALAYAVALALGSISAASRGRRTDLGIAIAVLVSYAIPSAVLGVVVARWTGADSDGLFWPTIVLALGLLAAPTRQQRSALAHALAQDYIRTAIAKGASRTRAIVVHGLRNATLPIVTMAGLEAPMALGGAFVVERVFGLDGLGDATIEAVRQRDVAWLMAISLFAAGASALGVIVTDLAYVTLDPRLRGAVLAGKHR